MLEGVLGVGASKGVWAWMGFQGNTVQGPQTAEVRLGWEVSEFRGDCRSWEARRRTETGRGHNSREVVCWGTERGRPTLVEVGSNFQKTRSPAGGCQPGGGPQPRGPSGAKAQSGSQSPGEGVIDQRTRLPGPEPAGQGRPPVATTGEAGI